MSTLKKELKQNLMQGKEAYIDQDIDLAIHSFEIALSIAQEIFPLPTSIIGVSQVFLNLSLAHKRHSGDLIQEITSAISLFPDIPKKDNSEVYSSILLSLGLEFQKISHFACSIIILKKALDFARTHTHLGEIEEISIISRNLAYSYHKIGKISSAAKLFRIAADLEDNPEITLDLYRCSAYFYYKDQQKEKALNIFQTALEKADFLGQTEIQTEITRFQGIISYEIFKDYQQRNLILANEYLKLGIDKFKSIRDDVWRVKLLYERAMVYESVDRIYNRNRVLKQIIQFRLNKNTEEYIIKAILLLTIHELEGEHFFQAQYYLGQIPRLQVEKLNPLLRQKIQKLRKILGSRKQGKLHANLKLSRKDLDFPLEEEAIQSIPRTKTDQTVEKQSVAAPPQPTTHPESEQHIVEIEVPTTTVPSSFSATNVQLTTVEVSVSSVPAPLEASSVEALFNEPEPEEIQLQLTGQEYSVEDIQDYIPSIDTQDPISPNSSLSADERIRENTDFSRLFRAHQESASDIPVSSSESEVDRPVVSSSEESTPVSSSIQPTEIARRFQQAGWTVQLTTPDNRKGAEPDIFAEKGLVRKKRKMVFIAEDPSDAEICSFLLKTHLESAEKIVFLLSGDPSDVNISPEVKVITQIDRLF